MTENKRHTERVPHPCELRLGFQVGDRAIDVRGHVVQVMPQFGFGVRFDDLSPAAEAAISALVAQGS